MIGMRLGRVLTRGLMYIVLIGGCIVILIPFVWMLSTSLKPASEVYIYPPALFPKVIRWQNYVDVLTGGFQSIWIYVRNTILYMCLPVLVLDVLVNAMVGFAFARVRFRGSQPLFLAALATMMLPNQVTMIPLFILFARLGWMNTYLPIIVPAAFGWPYAIFLLRQFFASVPDALDDAARIDGCDIWSIMWRIHFPLAAPALGIIGIFSFTGQWNEYLRPLLYLKDIKLWPLGLYLQSLVGSGLRKQWQMVMVVAVLMCLPPVALFFIAQRRYIQGIVITGVKG